MPEMPAVPKEVQRLGMEFLGTFFLCLSVSCITHMPAGTAGLVVGGTLMVMVYAGGPVSGGHYNPAVTLAIWVRGELIEAKEAAQYVVVQLLAACWAAVIADGIYSFKSNAYCSPGKDIRDASAFAVEVFMTFALAYVVLHVATRKEVAGNSYFGLAIGLTLVAVAYSSGPISGAAINPAVGMLTFLNGDDDDARKKGWIYLVAPNLGGALAGFTFKFTTADEEYAPLLVEFIGTFYLCFTIALGVSAANGTSMAPVSIGAMLMVMVYAGGPISGGCYNPVVAGAVAVRNVGTKLDAAIKPAKLGLYVLAEIVGACCAGAVAACVLVGNEKIGHPAVGREFSDGEAMLGEIIGTMLLVFTVLSVATVASTKDNSYFGLAIGFALMAGAAAVGGASGGAFNPAVSMLTLIAEGSSEDAWLFWFGPGIGALLAVVLFRVLYYEDIAAEAGAPAGKAGLEKPTEGYATLA